MNEQNIRQVCISFGANPTQVAAFIKYLKEKYAGKDSRHLNIKSEWRQYLAEATSKT
jgi:hypothetical protein